MPFISAKVRQLSGGGGSECRGSVIVQFTVGARHLLAMEGDSNRFVGFVRKLFAIENCCWSEDAVKGGAEQI